MDVEVMAAVLTVVLVMVLVAVILVVAVLGMVAVVVIRAVVQHDSRETTVCDQVDDFTTLGVGFKE